MDELQARIRTRRSLQTEMNLAQQPYPEFDHSSGDQLQGETKVVEMPQRQVQHESASEQSQPQSSTAKRKQGTAKRKQTATQKAFPFGQMRDGHQQPYIDELKRLEAQAERINQLLAERKRKKALADLSGGLANGATVETETLAPKKKAAKGSKPSRSPQREVPPMPAQEDDTKALEAQAERIKQLLKELETALVEEGIEERAVPPQQAIEHNSIGERPQVSTTTTAVPPVADVESFPSGTYRYAANAAPLTSQTQATPETDQKAQQEATETAQALRYLANRDVTREPRGRELIEPAIGGSTHYARQDSVRSRDHTGSNASSLRHYGFRLRQLLQIPQTSFDKVGDAVLWIVLAAAIRVGAQSLLTLFPALTPLFLLLLVAPAAFAVYLAMFVPRAGFVSIYRLFLTMLGLLLGGRL